MHTQVPGYGTHVHNGHWHVSWTVWSDRQQHTTPHLTDTTQGDQSNPAMTPLVGMTFELWPGGQAIVH